MQAAATAFIEAEALNMHPLQSICWNTSDELRYRNILQPVPWQLLMHLRQKHYLMLQFGLHFFWADIEMPSSCLLLHKFTTFLLELAKSGAFACRSHETHPSVVDNISSLVAHINANRPVRKVVALTHQGDSNTDNSGTGTSKWIQPSGKEPGKALLVSHSSTSTTRFAFNKSYIALDNAVGLLRFFCARRTPHPISTHAGDDSGCCWRTHPCMQTIEKLTLLSVPVGPRRPGQGIEDEEQGIVGGVQTETG